MNAAVTDQPRWVFDPAPVSQAKKGGLAGGEVFDATIDSFVREVLQNARDQARGNGPVRVRFRLSEVRGSALTEVLDACGWDSLERHVQGAVDQEFVTISPRLARAMKRISDGEPLRVMTIEDSGTHGLVGEEDDEHGNFAALCKHELITGKDRRTSGGSFGLGKSVLWRFSSLSSVIFGSQVADPADATRFIGRCLLPWHVADGRSWEGQGWFGAPETREGGMRAVSLWDEPARLAASRCGIRSPAGRTGTTIVILGFAELADVDRTVDEICDDIARSTVRWFWPALERREMAVEVEGLVDGSQVFDEKDLTATGSDVGPFLDATSRSSDQLVEALVEPGDVTEVQVPFAVPARRATALTPAAPKVSSEATLRIRLAAPDESGHRDVVALQRGTGMIVAYRPVRGGLGTKGLHAVLSAGTARGDDESDVALEAFLRAAEPPAHSEWRGDTERVGAEYERGATKALQDFFKQVDNVLKRLSREEPSDTKEGPAALRRLFPMPGVGTPEREPTYRLTGAKAELVGDRWEVTGTYVRRPLPGDDASSWSFSVALRLDQEGSGARVLPIGTFEALGEGTTWNIESGVARVRQPAVTTSVSFRGRSDAVELPPGGLRQVGLVIDVRATGTEAVDG